MPYVHVVFTLPHELSWLTLHNKKVVFDLLFRASAATLLEIVRESILKLGRGESPIHTVLGCLSGLRKCKPDTECEVRRSTNVRIARDSGTKPRALLRNPLGKTEPRCARSDHQYLEHRKSKQSNRNACRKE